MKKFLFIIICISIFTNCYSQNDDTLEYYQKGMDALNEKQYEIAIESLEKYVELTDNANGKYQLGKAYLFAGKNLEKAIKIYETYIKNYKRFKNKYQVPGLDGAYWRLGLVYERKGDLKKAE
ncbi:MAG TPA: tetratricopeptide repeat protein, partial [Candidatus Cloacimonetes bacterium]|nr:tetratricopeptide repeat protein [Candidatus Cloacimonadota bacterium]